MRIYLDNAATSWPKPESVYAAIDQYHRDCGAAAGRGAYADAEQVERTVTQTRTRIGNLINGPSPNIVFGHNCTDALNLALHGLLQPNDHVITSVAEHNSILRPLNYLTEHRHISVTTVSTLPNGLIDLRELAQQITPRTRLIALAHASNVTGTMQPIEQIGRIAQAHGCSFLVDAAQTLGHFPIDVTSQGIDLLAAPGHKGLFGPLGTGLLYIAADLVSQLDSTRQGGTGTQSESPTQPDESPSKYEAGNLNVPGIVGLDAGVQYVVKNGLVESDHLLKLSRHVVESLQQTPGVDLFSQANVCGIVSFNVAGYDAREVATALDASAGIQVRAGLHCAPLMHQALKTSDAGGTVRASFGHFSTIEEADKLIEAVDALAANPMSKRRE